VSACITVARAFLLCSALSFATSLYAAPKSTPAGPCATLPHSDHPTAHISNGEVDLVVFLPDADNGYYRSSRFDWSGIIGCASYRGHTYFGEWFGKYDPMISDAVTGPAEEFRADDGKELGYADAPVGGEFVKPGVGVLTKLKDEPYRFGTVYPIVDRGAWEVKVKGRSITFTQRLRSKTGYAYDYTKVLELNPAGSTFTLRHTLRNVGIKAIDTNVYDHDFFMLDGKPTGAGDTVTFGFAPVAKEPLGDAAAIQGNQIVFLQEPSREHTAQGYLTGWEGKPGEYHVHVVDTSTGVGITQMSDAPISNSYFWSTAKTICPELYIPVHVQPKKSQQWDIHYTLEAPR
jgi:hypothetical protein